VIWHKYFKYEDGKLLWKYRNRDEFKNKAGQSAANRFAGKEAGNLHGAPRSATTYRQVEIFGKGYKVHRIIWEMHNGEIPDGYVVDHIDGDGLNNKIENLRIVDSLESMHNLPRQKTNKTGVVGVCWHKAANAWQARISWDGVRIDLGRYEKFEDAVNARKLAEVSFGYHQNHGRSQDEA